MPTMPVNAAGWRIEPPVSVPVAPSARRAATAAAEPPDEPPGTSGVFAPLRRHGDSTGPKNDVSFDEPIANSSLLVLPSITRAVAPELRDHGRFIGRHEILENSRARGRAHALGAEHVLHRDRNAFERPRLAAREARIRIRAIARACSGVSMHESVQRARLFHRREVRIGEFHRADLFLGQCAARLRDRERRELAQTAILIAACDPDAAICERCGTSTPPLSAR